MKFERYERLIFPLILLFICFIVYGLFTPFLGFYWDDFPYIWFKVADGVQGTINAITLDRPVLALFYALPMSILGVKPLAWQLFAIFTRWLFTLSMYGFLQTLWPNKRQSNQLIALLLSVFPGFTQQWISVIYSHAFLIFSLYFLSQIIFVKNLKAEKPSLMKTIISIMIALICMTATEYVVGLELMRVLIIFVHEKKANKTKSMLDVLKSTILKWSPYLFGLIVFLVYRLFLASSVLYKTQNVDGFLTSPIATGWELITTQFRNIYISLFPSWGAAFTPLWKINFSSRYWQFYSVFLLILILISALFLIFQNKIKKHNLSSIHTDKNWLKEAISLSFFILFFSGIPFWAASLPLSIDFPNNRFLLPFMLGSTLVIYIVLDLFRSIKIMWAGIFCFIFALSGSFQLYQAKIYWDEWDYFTRFFQQVSWRIPSMEENTVLVTDQLPLTDFTEKTTDQLPFIHYTDNSLSAALNWLYAIDPANGSLPYLLTYTNIRLGNSLPSLTANTPIHQHYRTYAFNGSTDQMVLFYYQPPGCVHFIDPVLDHLNPLTPQILKKAANLSHLNFIQETQKQNKVFFLDDSPNNSWCYYYQKASLAYQNQDWDELVKIGDTAFKINDYPNDASERIPFIFGYAYTGQLEKAVQITQTIEQISYLYRPMLCEAWEIIKDEQPDIIEEQGTFSYLENQLNCWQIEQAR